MKLFEGADTNTIGNSVIISPAASPSKAPNGLGQPKTVVKFQPAATGSRSGDRGLEEQETDPRVLTVSLYAQPNPPSATSGPVTGIVLFGTGSGNTQIAEFDIPVMNNNIESAISSLPFAGGVQISVPATSLEVRARHDANLIPSSILAGTPTSVAIGNPTGAVTPPPVLVTGSIAAGVKPTYARTYRTVWMFFNPLVPLPVGDTSAIPIPPFATSVRVARAQGGVGGSSPQITIDVLTAFGNIDTGTIVPAGTSCPEIQLSGQSAILRVTDSDAAITATAIAAIFTIGI